MPKNGITAPTRAAVLRALGFAAFWILLTGGNPTDLGAGAVAVLAATWTSLRLMPLGAIQVMPIALVQLAPRFLSQWLIAGLDVARRALDPRLPLRPGFAIYPVALHPGPAHNMFTTLMSLIPGTVQAGADARRGLLIHCLDVEQPIAARLAAEEAYFARIVGTASCGG